MNAAALIMPEELAAALLRDCKHTAGALLKAVEHLAGQASKRRYYRLKLRNCPLGSVVLLVYPTEESLGLVGGMSGASLRPPEEVYLELSTFFRLQELPVPEVYHYSPFQRALLIEDLGSQPLWRFLQNDIDLEGEKILSHLGEGWLMKLYQRAIDIIKKFQSLKAQADVSCFQRFLSFENYRRELDEFIEFYASQRGLKRSAREVLENNFDALCETLASFPRTLSHFDFMAYNLHVSPQGEIGVLDFQDACLTSPARDVVSLLNDRGTDEALGRERHSQLLRYYMRELGCRLDFAFQYDITLLHWDLRVSGRFVKLGIKMQTGFYEQFIPGTLRRLGRTLARCHRTLAGLEDMLEILVAMSPEVRSGSDDVWDFPQADNG